MIAHDSESGHATRDLMKQIDQITKGVGIGSNLDLILELLELSAYANVLAYSIPLDGDSQYHVVLHEMRKG